MLIDTHCHIDAMVKKTFNIPLETSHFDLAAQIIEQSKENHVTILINVGTNLIESNNSVTLAQRFDSVFATVGIHPNDCNKLWRQDFKEIVALVKKKEKNKIVGIGECGIDRHYPGHDLPQQCDAFKAHIELALEADLALVIHSRDAYDETLHILDLYKNDIRRGVIHCFSYDLAFAQQVIEWNCVLGLGGTVTYPKNSMLRTVATAIDIQHIVLETDAPFLPPQDMRGKQNHPKYIKNIAEFIAQLRETSF
jgi:TatD DNase family protein